MLGRGKIVFSILADIFNEVTQYISMHCKHMSHEIVLFTKNVSKKKNSVVLVHKQTIPIERSPPVSEASANFSG
jgi:hypothetical protein